MEYEAKKWDTKNISTKQDGSADFTVGIITGIVGDTYGFIKGDTTIINIPNVGGKTGDQTIVELQSGVNSFVASKYPNT